MNILYHIYFILFCQNIGLIFFLIAEYFIDKRYSAYFKEIEFDLREFNSIYYDTVYQLIKLNKKGDTNGE